MRQLSLRALFSGAFLMLMAQILNAQGGYQQHTPPIIDSAFPDCDAPIDVHVTNVDYHSLQLEWMEPEDAFGAYSYEVRYRLDRGLFNDQSPWEVMPVRRMMGFTLDRLIAGATYEIEVRRLCDLTLKLYSKWVKVGKPTSLYYPSRGLSKICDLFEEGNVVLEQDNSVTITWTGPDISEHYLYDLRYRSTSLSGVSDWVYIIISSGSAYNINGLASNAVYEFEMRLISTRGGGSNCDWEPIGEVIIIDETPGEDPPIIEEPEPEITLPEFDCGEEFTPPVITNTTPLAQADTGDIFFIMGFPILIDQINGGAGTFSGQGILPLPFQQKTVRVSFNSISVNEDYQITAGQVKGIADDPNNYPNLTSNIISLGGPICIPPQQVEGFDENGIHSETGLPWNPNGFDVNGQYVQQPPYPGYQEGDPYDPNYDPNGFDSDGNHFATNSPYNENGCNQQGFTEDGQPCNPAGSSPYYWLQDQEAAQPTQAGIQLADQVKDTLDDLIVQALNQFLSKNTDSIAYTTAICNGIRGDMETQLSSLGYDRTFIFGSEDKYFSEGMSEFFTEKPKPLGINIERNPTHEEFEENHVGLWYCDDALTKLKCGKTYIEGLLLPEALLLLTDEFLITIKTFSEEEVQTYSDLSNLFAWVEAQLSDKIKSECKIGEYDDMGYNEVPSKYNPSPSFADQLLSNVLWANTETYIPYENESFIFENMRFQYLQGYEYIGGVHRSLIMDQIYKTRLMLPPSDDAHQLMPITVVKEIAGVEQAIYLDNIVITPQSATLNVYFVLEVPSSGDKIAFNAIGVGFGPTGLMEEGKLEMNTDIEIRITNSAMLIINGTEDTFVAWDCDGFAGMGLDASIEFCREYIVPLEPNTLEVLPDPARARAHFVVEMPAWGEFITQINVDPFSIAGAEDIKWEVHNATLDFSDVSTPNNILFPENYGSSFVNNAGVASPLWRGFYLEELTVTMPREMTTSDDATNDEPVSLSVHNVIIDDRGVTGRAAIGNLMPLSDGKNLGKWAFSIDTFSIDVVANNLAGIGFDGLINIPLFRSNAADNAPLTEADCFQYKAQVFPGNVYNFSISPATNGTLKVPLWVAEAKLDSNSTLSITYDNGDVDIEAILHGEIAIGETNDNVDLDIPALTFCDVKLRNKAPYFDSGTWGFPDSLGGQFGGFGIVLHDIGLHDVENSDDVALNFGIHLNLVNDEFAVGAGGSFEVIGEIQEINNRQRWNYKNFKVNELHIDASFPGVDKIAGQLIFFDNHQTFGTGFRGVLKVAFAGLGNGGEGSAGLDALAHFGRIEENEENYKYFFVDVMTKFTPGVPIVPGLNLVGFGGGVYYHMERDTTQQSIGIPVNPTNGGPPPTFPVLGESLSGVLYTPSIDAGLGLKATVAIATQNEAAFNANLTFEISFYDGGGLKEARFYGNGKVMQELDTGAPPTHSTGKPNNNANVNFFIDILYNHAAKTLDASFEVYMRIGDIVHGAGANDKFSSTVAHFGPDGWYIRMGTPSNRNGITMSVPGVEGLGFTLTSYLMIGKDIPPMPPLPSYAASLTGAGNFMANESLRATGNGFAFGASAEVNIPEIGFLAFYAQFDVGLGFDVMMQDYGDAICAQSGDQIGINGWYASGQAWAYFAGDIGLDFKLFGSDKKAKIMTVAAGAVLQMKLPNPFWARGSVGGRYSIMGGLVKGQCNFEVEIGESCQIVGGDDPLADLSIILDVTPADKAEQLSVNIKPNASFNLPVEESFDVVDLNNNTLTYEAVVQEAKLTQLSSNAPIFGDTAFIAGGYSMDFTPVNMLPANDSFQFDLKVQILENGVEQEIETRSVIFKTGDPLEIIPEGNVLASYPINGQYNFYKDEWSEHKGYILLDVGQPDLFNNVPEGYEQGVRLTRDDGYSPNTLLPITYIYEEKKIEFAMPKALLSNGRFYKLELVNEATNSGGGENTSSSSYTTPREGSESDPEETYEPTTTANTTPTTNNSDSYETDSPNNSSDSNPIIPDQIIYTMYFRVSEYDKFRDKLDDIEQNYQDATVTASYVVRSELGINEPFDRFELGKDENVDQLISCQARLDNSSWYQNVIDPLLYENFPGSVPLSGVSDLFITRRPIEVGTPPVKAVSIEPENPDHLIEVNAVAYGLGQGVAYGVGIISNTTQYIRNQVPNLMYIDYWDYIGQLKDIVDGFTYDSNGEEFPIIPSGPLPDLQNTVNNANFPVLPQETYRIEFTYKLPGTGIPTTFHTIDLEN